MQTISHKNINTEVEKGQNLSIIKKRCLEHLTGFYRTIEEITLGYILASTTKESIKYGTVRYIGKAIV